MSAFLALLLLVKKRSVENSSFCIKSTRLQFAIGKVIIVAIVWFVNVPHIYMHWQYTQPARTQVLSNAIKM